MEKKTKNPFNRNPYLLAKKCGARRNRVNLLCKKPAMKNGRCDRHGGKCTGPKTAEGRARIAAARTTHGLRTKQAKEERKRIKEMQSWLKDLDALVS